MRPSRGICPECERDYSLRWNYSHGLGDGGGWTLRRHRRTDGKYCDGEQHAPMPLPLPLPGFLRLPLP